MCKKESKFLVLWYLVLKEQGRAELAGHCSLGTIQHMCMTSLHWHDIFKKKMNQVRELEIISKGRKA
jgi:hypothetical protein